MGFLAAVRGAAWRGVWSAGLVCVCASGAAENHSRTKHAVALSPWEQASRARAEFEAQPAGTHTRTSYLRVLEQCRAVYHDDPADAHAPDAVYVVAELLAEEGRELGEDVSLRNAVGQYEFLRAQYPESPLRTQALLAEAQIEDRDLNDHALAREKYRALLHDAPKSKAAGEARLALGQTLPTPQATRRRGSSAKPEPAASGMRLTEENARAAGAESANAPTGADTGPAPIVVETPPEAVPVTQPVRRAGGDRGNLAQVTGIRHWSTATYTRVAIDLGDEVTFEAARVPNPDRIYFDLHGARLGSELVGKSFSVTDDGFLKRIRAAQASPDVTRVVLDVSDVTEYSAFLLPNPYRLIIDIHGAKGSASSPQMQARAPMAEQPVPSADPARASAAANSSGLPAMAPTDGGETFRPNQQPAQQPAQQLAQQPALQPAQPPPPQQTLVASLAPPTRPVPNTVAVKAPATTTEVNAVSSAPGRVDATIAPTSKPIAATVPVPVNLGTGRKRRTKNTDAAGVGDAAPAKAAEKTADGETSLIRALGLKINRIVIDAGHGGHDSGTLGVDGIEEKDVVLDVALRLGKLLHERLGAEIIYTRSDDTFIPLETRTAIANKAQADLFLSIHANSSSDASARGVETYYLNFTSDAAALDVAARENAVGGQSIHQLSDLVKKITLKDKIEESREFASDVEGSLYAGLEKGNDGLRNRGVKKAPFVVLIGANMPSILAEISFVTNPRDASQLRQPEYRERVAESLFTGVARYENGLAGARAPVPMVRASTR